VSLRAPIIVAFETDGQRPLGLEKRPVPIRLLEILKGFSRFAIVPGIVGSFTRRSDFVFDCADRLLDLELSRCLQSSAADRIGCTSTRAIETRRPTCTLSEMRKSQSLARVEG